ncbi:MAG: hypothetical protein ACK5W1_11005 [Flavobacteriales bacterium]
MRRAFLLFATLWLCALAWSQGPGGLGYTPYSGITSVSTNPALAGGRFKVDAALFSAYAFQQSSVYPVNATFTDFDPVNWNNFRCATDRSHSDNKAVFTRAFRYKVLLYCWLLEKSEKTIGPSALVRMSIICRAPL